MIMLYSIEGDPLHAVAPIQQVFQDYGRITHWQQMPIPLEQRGMKGPDAEPPVASITGVPAMGGCRPPLVRGRWTLRFYRSGNHGLLMMYGMILAGDVDDDSVVFSLMHRGVQLARANRAATTFQPWFNQFPTICLPYGVKVLPTETERQLEGSEPNEMFWQPYL